MAAIELVDVTKCFGDFAAVDHLSFSVISGEIFGLLGPNGSGKTTTINMVTGLAQPTSGRVLVLGRDAGREAVKVRASLGAVPQETALYEDLTARANLEFHADLYGVPRRTAKERIARLLSLVQLADRAESKVGSFSGGMKRRLALARALLHEPELIFLDEPTLGVDVQSRKALWNHILSLKEEGRTVLITTNYLEEASTLCDRLAIIDHGKLVALDAPRKLTQRFGDTIIECELAHPLTAVLLEDLKKMAGVRDASLDETTLKVILIESEASTGDIVTWVVNQVPLKSIHQREPNLNEVFLNLTGAAVRD